jgi:hypothetical protein
MAARGRWIKPLAAIRAPSFRQERTCKIRKGTAEEDAENKLVAVILKSGAFCRTEESACISIRREKNRFFASLRSSTNLSATSETVPLRQVHVALYYARRSFKGREAAI